MMARSRGYPALAALLLAAAACSSDDTIGARAAGAGAADASNGSPASDAAGGIDARIDDAGATADGTDAAPDDDGFIQADVDGVTVRASARLGGLVDTGLNEAQLAASTSKTPSDLSDRSFGLAFINAVATYTCDAAPRPVLTYALMIDGAPQYWSSGDPSAPCTITVTAAAPGVGDFVVGTFSGTLKVSGDGAEHTFVNGSFRVRRTQ